MKQLMEADCRLAWLGFADTHVRHGMCVRPHMQAGGAHAHVMRSGGARLLGAADAPPAPMAALLQQSCRLDTAASAAAAAAAAAG